MVGFLDRRTFFSIVPTVTIAFLPSSILNNVSAGIVTCFTILPRFRLTTQVARSDSDANTTVLSVSVIVKGR